MGTFSKPTQRLFFTTALDCLLAGEVVNDLAMCTEGAFLVVCLLQMQAMQIDFSQMHMLLKINIAIYIGPVPFAK